MVHAGLPAVGVGAVPGGGGGQLCEGPAAGWLVVVHTVPAWRGHQVGRLGLAAPAEAGRASLVESVDVEPGEKHRVGGRWEVGGGRGQGNKPAGREFLIRSFGAEPGAGLTDGPGVGSVLPAHHRPLSLLTGTGDAVL